MVFKMYSFTLVSEYNFQFLSRIANLELMTDYGCEAWRVYNEVLQTLVNKLQNR